MLLRDRARRSKSVLFCNYSTARVCEAHFFGFTGIKSLTGRNALQKRSLISENFLPFQQGGSPGKTGAKAGEQQSITF